MDNNLILTANRFWDSVTEHCASSVNISTDLSKDEFMTFPGKWTLGLDNVNDPDRCVKRLSNDSYPGSTMGEYTEYLVGSSLDDWYCISESAFENGGDDYTTMASLPTGTGDKLIRYGDLVNNVDYTIFTPNISYSYIVGRMGTNTFSGYINVVMFLYSSQYDSEIQCTYDHFKYSDAGSVNNTKKVLLIAEENGLDSVDSLRINVSVGHTSAYTVNTVTFNGTIPDNGINLTRTYSSNTVTVYSYTKEMNADEIKNLFNNSISNSFSISIVSANTAPALTQRFVADLNSEWMTGSTNPNSSTYYSFQSGKNKGVDNSMDSMYIRFSGYSQFTLHIRSNGENNWDYVMVSQLNTTITSATSYSASTVKANTRGLSTSGTSLASYKAVTFTGLSTSSAYTIQVCYRKDSSTSHSADTGYVLIPKTYGSYINAYTASTSTTSTSKLYWETFYLTNASGTRMYLDSYYMAPNINEFDLYSKDFGLVTSTVGFTSGATGGEDYIEIENDSLDGFVGYGFIVLQFKNVLNTYYGSLFVAIPIQVTTANGNILSDFGECYIFKEDVTFSFTYQNINSSISANFNIYPPFLAGLANNYIQVSNGVTDGFLNFFSTQYITERNGYSNSDYQISGQSYTYVFCPNEHPNVSLIPSDCTVLTNVFHWHYNYVNNKTSMLYYITPA